MPEVAGWQRCRFYRGACGPGQRLLRRIPRTHEPIVRAGRLLQRQQPTRCGPKLMALDEFAVRCAEMQDGQPLSPPDVPGVLELILTDVETSGHGPAGCGGLRKHLTAGRQRSMELSHVRSCGGRRRRTAGSPRDAARGRDCDPHRQAARRDHGDSPAGPCLSVRRPPAARSRHRSGGGCAQPGSARRAGRDRSRGSPAPCARP
jgi:hypothetical protein